MITPVCYLLFLFPADHVELSHLGRFKIHKYECETQLTRHREWLLYLEYLSCIHGRTDEIEGWKRATEWQATYWHLLYECHENWLIGDEWRLTQLQRLREHIGDYRYKKGWTPILFPNNLPKVPVPRERGKGTPA